MVLRGIPPIGHELEIVHVDGGWLGMGGGGMQGEDESECKQGEHARPFGNQTRRPEGADQLGVSGKASNGHTWRFSLSPPPRVNRRRTSTTPRGPPARRPVARPWPRRLHHVGFHQRRPRSFARPLAVEAGEHQLVLGSGDNTLEDQVPVISVRKSQMVPGNGTPGAWTVRFRE